ncbi:hypothetical protein, partial [Kitasatospora sp. MBT66]|uniref:hypothetical protein n=1 Tax=Kitasatospora sp. MBT66 TaxID=1444769 RepID=UPI001A7E05F3
AASPEPVAPVPRGRPLTAGQFRGARRFDREEPPTAGAGPRAPFLLGAQNVRPYYSFNFYCPGVVL